jgi:cell division protein FtsZ
MKESFKLSDDILKTGVKSISDLITEEGYINLDFADVRTIMEGAGYAHLAIGHGAGKDKAKEAANAVITSPLLETSIAGARRLLINIAMSEDTLSQDVDTASKMITDTAADGVEFIFGTAFKEDMKDEMTITVIAANFTGDDSGRRAPVEDYLSGADDVLQIDNPDIGDFKQATPQKPPLYSPHATGGYPAPPPFAAAPPPTSTGDEDDIDAIFKILEQRK